MIKKQGTSLAYMSKRKIKQKIERLRGAITGNSGK